jgi:predicted ATP-grasp superfamily ATP-dependent carboligase
MLAGEPCDERRGTTIAAMVPPPGVLVTDAHERAAVAGCESLSRAGYRVGVAGVGAFAPARWSRFTESSFDTPDPRDERRGFTEAVARIVHEGEFATVIPGSDASLIAISSNRDLFAAATNLGLPSPEVVSRCVSKVDLVDAADEAGLTVPQSIVCADRGEAIAAAEQLGYPVILKPRSTVFSLNGHIRQRQTVFAGDRAALDSRLPEYGFPCLLQRREQGSIISIGGAMTPDGLLATATSKYIRTWLPDAGSVSFSKTIAPPAELVEAVERLVSLLGWNGVFELELIELSEGRFAAIDFNPRLYGSLALAVDAGASLPAIWCDWLLKGRAERRTARPGVYYRWDDADLRHIWRSLRKARVRAAISVARPRRHTVHPYFRGGDPKPVAARWAQMLRNGLIARGS